MPRHEDRPLLLTVPAAAHQLGISERFLWELIRNGKLLHVRLGRLVRLRPADLETFLAERTGDYRAKHLKESERAGA